MPVLETMFPPRCRVVALAALAAGLAACAAARPQPQPAQPPATRMSADSLAELEALYRARTEEQRARHTAADVRFMTDMIAHHGQALLMADLAATRAGSPAVRTLAARIRVGQADEIALMQRWLRERRQPVPEVHIEGARLMIHGTGHDAAHHAEMPGMLTTAQLSALEAASGTAFDRLFLTYMIEHHRGAVVMVDTLLAAAGAMQDPTVFRLASDIHTEQLAEIARMEQLLATLPAR